MAKYTVFNLLGGNPNVSRIKQFRIDEYIVKNEEYSEKVYQETLKRIVALKDGPRIVDIGEYLGGEHPSCLGKRCFIINSDKIDVYNFISFEKVHNTDKIFNLAIGINKAPTVPNELNRVLHAIKKAVEDAHKETDKKINVGIRIYEYTVYVNGDLDFINPSESFNR